MARGKGNALNPALVEELHEAIDAADGDGGVRGVVLASASPSIFCGGFDAREVFPFGENQIHAFFSRFVDLCARMIRTPKPLIAAVNGHALAGGAVLALSCDERVMAEGEYGFGLNEINLGMPVTPGMVEMTVRAAGAPAAREMLLGGEPLTPRRALAVGLACEVTAAGALLERACERARFYGAKPSAAFAALKRSLWRAVEERIGHDGEGIAEFVRQWASPESVARRAALAGRLRR